jgi:regulation of enolase protein 1 (concanavalin A-like superfamily)
MRITKAAALAALAGLCLFTNIGAAGAQSPPAPWAAQDIGAPALAGDAAFAGGTFRIDAAGVDIRDQRDRFHFVYQPIDGDVDVRARIDSITRVDKWSTAGVMIRSSLDDDAAHGYALVSVAMGTGFERRTAPGATSEHTAGRRDAAPIWVRLVRSGSTLTAYTSPDGRSWTLVGSDTVALGRIAYVGLAVTSHEPARRATADISNLTILPLALPDGQASIDIGRPKVSGGVTYASGAYSIHAGGIDIWDAADQFHYVYQPVSGDVEIVARVRSMAEAHRWSKTGVMIRETLDAGSRHATALTSARMGHAFRRRTEPDRWSAHTSGGSGTAPVWLRLVRTGSVFEAFRSADGRTWTSMGTDVIPMADTVYVGLAAASHSPREAMTAVIDQVTITASGEPDEPTEPPANQPPVVLLTSPADGTTHVAPADLTLGVSATDADGTITSVEFYAGATLLGRAAAEPYTLAVGAVPEGTYRLTAVATDDDGARTTSAAVTITVASVAGPPAPEPPDEEPPPAEEPPPSGTPPRGVAFTVSDDHETLVTHYVLEIHAQGTTPGTAAPVASSNLGKPEPSSTGDVFVDRSAFFAALAPGTYIASVKAVGASGSARSESVTFTR